MKKKLAFFILIFSLNSVLAKFFGLIEQRCPMAQFCVWVSGIVESYATTTGAATGPGSRTGSDVTGGLVTRIRRFLSVWTSVTSRMLKQLKAMKPNTSASMAFSNLLGNY